MLCVMQWLSMICFEMFVMSFPVCLVSSCPFCLVLSVLFCSFRLASSCLVLFVLSRPVSLCLVLSVFCPPDLVPSVVSRLVSFMPSLTRPACFSGPVRLCFLSRPYRLCFLCRHVRFVVSCPFCPVTSVSRVEQRYVGGNSVYSANVVICRSLWPDVGPLSIGLCRI